MHLVGTRPRHNQRRVWIAYAMLVVMNIIDMIYATLSGGGAGNPAMDQMYQLYGIWGIAFVKAFFLWVLAMVLGYLPQLSVIYRYLFYLFVVVYAALTGYHVFWLVLISLN